MVKIGLVGEDPNDTYSLKNLLLKKYKGEVQFFPLVKGIKGYQLDNPKVKRALPIEFSSKKCNFIIYIRDLDGFKTEKEKVGAKKKWFQELDAMINGKGMLLLNIWELEALIFADISSFNKLYSISYSFKKDPVSLKEPKEELKKITKHNNKKYKESHCPEIFNKLDFDVVEKNCSYFKEFISELNIKLKAK